MTIFVEHLGKNYAKVQALNNLNFSVEPGEIVGLLGPNGAGKSTLFKILSCLIRPNSGKVDICGFNVETQALDVRRNIGYLPENNPLYPNMFIREYLEFSAGFYHLGKLKKSRINEMIEITGLKDHLSKRIGILSKGLKQRVGLSQALLHDPKVLILDEPTSGLDPNQIVEIRKLILSLGSNKTILFSSHIIQEVEALCERVIILDEGKIIADGPTSRLVIGNGKNNIVNVQFNADVEEEDLLAIGRIKRIQQLKNSEWLIECEENIDIRKDLMAFAMKHNLTILSLNQESNKLEGVFHELTRKK
ncbi:MAG: gliding motility-associated ABC transporter ATP-binding subunit GldA [Bacteroidetes bacterium HGW-Bacteroidetes-17]|jgi:ABC-2 type transport system ATP-binding protein|nr:MAG: gliding motility-associated ABC transporter ATP-binding subunit GldA [Bacteroidetes bacterium HGW-Bacteroidetes-17]